MIAYLDSSALVRSYLTDEMGGNSIRELIKDPAVSTVTGSWSRIEVTGAFVRAERTGRFEFAALEAAFMKDTDPVGGPLLLVDSAQSEVELLALRIVRAHGLRAMDAWQLACAHLTFEALAEPGEERAFATRDAEQARIAKEWGYTIR